MTTAVLSAVVTVATVGYGDHFPSPRWAGAGRVPDGGLDRLIAVLSATFAGYFVGQDLDKT
jgi:hypothetical protein